MNASSDTTLPVDEAKLPSGEETVPVDDLAATPPPNPLATLSRTHKSALLALFSLSMFIDAAGIGAAFLLTSAISSDLGIARQNEAWVLGSYSLAFAAALLAAGRLAAVCPPNRVFVVGFALLGALSLGTSFTTDQYAFFVLRAFSGLVAVLTVPSAINMIVQMYPDPVEQAKSLALFGLAAGLANVLALLIAALCLLSSWRWYFRLVAIVVLPLSCAAIVLIPRSRAVAESLDGRAKLARMDAGGVFLLFGAMVLFITAFTQAPAAGYSSALFLVPLLLSLLLFPAFVVWEAKRPRGTTLLPHDIWQLPNILPLVVMASPSFLWFATYQLRLATWFQDVLHLSPLLTAAKLLPAGVTCLVVGLFTQPFPALVTRPRVVQPTAAGLMSTSTILLAFSDGGRGDNYSRFILPSMFIGFTGGMLNFVGTSTALTQAFPVEFAGVGGSFAQVVFQVFGVLGLAVQTALLGTGKGVDDWTGSRNGYLFTSAYALVAGLVFLVSFRPRAPAAAAV